MHMPAVEALFLAPWTAAARRVLPSPSPQLTATEMWGPVLAWCVLQWLAESINVTQPERTALDLFDRLRLREPFGHAFTALGFQGEEAWRVAARIKVLLLTGAGAGNEFVAPDSSPGSPTSGSLAGWGGSPAIPAASTLPEASLADAEAEEGKTASPASPPEEDQVALAHVLWLDPDVRWLCGVHESEGHFYLVREQYEELLWWLLMPALLRLAGEAAPSRAAVEELSKTVANALHSAETAEYRINALLGPLAAAEVDESLAQESEPADSNVSADAEI